MRRITIFIILILILFNNTLTANKKNQPVKGTMYHISVKTRLNARSTPSLSGKILFTLANGEMVSYEGKRKAATVNNIHGYWMLIYWQGKTAYVFSQFLKEFNENKYDTYILSEFKHYNHATKKGVIFCSKNGFGKGSNAGYVDFAFVKKNIHAKTVMPPAAYINFILKGKKINKRLFKNLQSGKKFLLHFLIEDFVKLKRKPYGITVNITCKVVKATKI